MILRKLVGDIMGRGGRKSRDETDSETQDDDTTESERSASTDKKTEFFGIPLYKLSYNQLPKSCIKFFFLALNGLTLFAGIAAIISSAWLLVDSKLISGFTGHRTFFTILFFIGLLVSFVSFIGILGFNKRRRKFLVIYITCHSLSLCIIFVCAIMSFIFFSKIVKKIKDDMVYSIDKYRSSEWVTESWDNTQRFLKCCGIKSAKDWVEHHMPIPQSCCSTSIEKCFSAMSESSAYKTGCYKNTVLLLKSYVNALSLSALLVSLALLASIFFGVGVCKRFKAYRTGRN